MLEYKKRSLEFKINMVNRVSKVLSNMVILLFIYFSLLGDVGKFMSDYYFQNNISMHEIIRYVFMIGSIAYIFYFVIRCICNIDRIKSVKFDIRELLSLYLSSLAAINYMFYFSETNNYIGIYILAVGLLISIIKYIIIIFLKKKINNFVVSILLILFLGICIAFYVLTSYSALVDKKAKVIYLINVSYENFQTVLEIDGEIIYKDGEDFYYKVKDKINQEIDVIVKENKLNDKVVELK